MKNILLTPIKEKPLRIKKGKKEELLLVKEDYPKNKYAF